MLLLFWLAILASSLIMTFRFWPELTPQRKTGLVVANSIYLTLLTEAAVGMVRRRGDALADLGRLDAWDAVYLLLPALAFGAYVLSFIRAFQTYRTWKELGWRTLLAVLHLELLGLIGYVWIKSWS